MNLIITWDAKLTDKQRDALQKQVAQAFPDARAVLLDGVTGAHALPLSRREQFAMASLQALIVMRGVAVAYSNSEIRAQQAREAVAYACALEAAL